MTLTLAATESVRGSAGTASAVAYTISGGEKSASGFAYKTLAQGYLQAAAAALYTASGVQGIVKLITLKNTTGVNVSVVMFVNGVGATNQLWSGMIPANGSATFNGEWAVYDASGFRQQVGATGPQGTAGNHGYSPILDVQSDGNRRVLRLQSWTGGTGTQPAGAGQYLSAAGLDPDLVDAIDIRGPQGIQGVPGEVSTAAMVAYAQPLDADLTAIAGLATTPYGRGQLSLADAAADVAQLPVATVAAKGLQSAADKLKQNGLHYDIVAQGGADRTGVADCTAIIEAAQATVAAAGGGVVYYPPGTYRIASTINLTGNFVTHRGAGRVSSLVQVDFASGDAYEVAGIFTAFEDLRIQGTNATLRTGGFAINFLSTASNCNVRRVDIIFQWSGVKLTGQLARLEDMNIREMGANAPNGQSVLIDAFVDQWIDGLIMDNPANQTGFAGIRITNLSSLIMSNCQVIHCNIGLDCAPAGTNTIPSIYCMNTFFDNGVIGARFQGAATGTVARCRFIQCWFSSNSQSGVLLDNPLINAVEFLGCEFYGNTQYGIDAVNAKEWSVRASRIAGNLTAGIRCQPGTVAGNHSFSITDNIIGATGNFGNNGISITILAGTYKRYQILDNRGLEQNNTPGYSNLGTTAAGDTQQVTNNLGLLPSGAIATIAADVTSSGTAAFALLTARIPANSVVPGTTIRVTIRGVTAASGNPTWSVAVGSASPGTTVAWTTAAMTSAAAAGGGMDVLLTVKTIGAGGTLTAAGLGYVLALTASSATATAVAVNTTADWFITARVAMSASTFRAVNGVIRGEN